MEASHESYSITFIDLVAEIKMKIFGELAVWDQLSIASTSRTQYHIFFKEILESLRSDNRNYFKSWLQHQGIDNNLENSLPLVARALKHLPNDPPILTGLVAYCKFLQNKTFDQDLFNTVLMMLNLGGNTEAEGIRFFTPYFLYDEERVIRRDEWLRKLHSIDYDLLPAISFWIKEKQDQTTLSRNYSILEVLLDPPKSESLVLPPSFMAAKDDYFKRHLDKLTPPSDSKQLAHDIFGICNEIEIIDRLVPYLTQHQALSFLKYVHEIATNYSLNQKIIDSQVDDTGIGDRVKILFKTHKYLRSYLKYKFSDVSTQNYPSFDTSRGDGITRAFSNPEIPTRMTWGLPSTETDRAIEQPLNTKPENIDNLIKDQIELINDPLMPSMSALKIINLLVRMHEVSSTNLQMILSKTQGILKQELNPQSMHQVKQYQEALSYIMYMMLNHPDLINDQDYQVLVKSLGEHGYIFSAENKSSFFYLITKMKPSVIQSILDSNPLSGFTNEVKDRIEIPKKVSDMLGISFSIALSLVSGLRCKDIEKVTRILSTMMGSDMDSLKAESIFGRLNTLCDIIKNENPSILDPRSQSNRFNMFISDTKNNPRYTLRSAAFKILETMLEKMSNINERLKLLELARNQSLFNTHFSNDVIRSIGRTGGEIAIDKMINELKINQIVEAVKSFF